MKLVTYFAIFAIFIAVQAAITKVSLVIESDNKNIDGKGIITFREYPRIYYCFVGEDTYPFNLTYDTQKHVLYTPLAHGDKDFFAIQGDIALLGVVDASKATFKDTYLSVNGTIDGFYACKNTNDPYNHSERYYTLIYKADRKVPNGCISLKVKKK